MLILAVLHRPLIRDDLVQDRLSHPPDQNEILEMMASQKVTRHPLRLHGEEPNSRLQQLMVRYPSSHVFPCLPISHVF